MADVLEHLKASVEAALDEEGEEAAGDEWQASTSSTSPPEEDTP